MRLILTHSIKKKEFIPLKAIFDMEGIKFAAKKSLLGLGKEIKGSFKVPSTILKKIYLTSSGSAGRGLFLLQINKEQAILVMLRSKNDKKIGANMTIKNSQFKSELEKNLTLIMKEIKSGNYEEFEL